MNLVLHIVRKDTRHLYPEILVTLVLTAVFALTAPAQWLFGSSQVGINASAGGLVYLLGPLLRVLLPVAWLVLISRLVHDESLVGDRQFWITRPYTWPTLLASKLLFLLVFLYVPFVLMQLYLLHHAGFSIAAALPDLLRYELRLTTLFILPFLVLAALTSTFARLSLTLLIALLYLIGVFALGGYLFNQRMFPPYVYTADLMLSALALTAIFMGQYATRRTRANRIALAAVPLALLLLSFAAPAKTLIDRAYAASPNTPHPNLAVDPDPLRQEPGANAPMRLDDRVFITLPVQHAGFPAGLRYKAKGISVTISTPQGLHWTSPFLNTGTDLPNGNPNLPAIDFSLPVSIFDRIRDTPVDLHLQLATVVYGTDPSEIATASNPIFPAPDRGLCPLTPEGFLSNCRYALRLPTPIDISAQVGDHRCDTAPDPHAEHALARYFVGADENYLAFDFDPITTSSIYLNWPQQRPDQTPRQAHLCPGTPVTFTPHPLLTRTELSLDAHNLVLAPYAKRRLSTARTELHEQ